MTPADRAQQRLQELAARLEPALRRAFLDLSRSLTPERLSDLVRLLEAGNLDAAVTLLTTAPGAVAATAAVRATWTAGLLRVVQATTADLNAGAIRRTVRVIAPVQSPEMIAAVRRWEDGAFARVAADLRAGLRETMATELARGLGPRQVAVALKQGVGGGLTAYDVKIIQSFRAALEDGRTGDAMRRALRDRRYKITDTLTPAQIDTAVAAYRRKLIAFRAETFARTAAMQAANEANAVGWYEAIRQGAVPASEVRQFWVVSPDERLCEVCAPIPSLNQAGVLLGEAFVTPNGPVLLPPLHPNCVLGDTPITATPAIHAVTQRAYEGPVVVIETASGKHLRCTPNHPVLTPIGWVAAGALDVGGHVVRYLGGDRVPTVDHDHEHMPPRIEQIAEAFGRAPGVAPREVPVSTEHFHGDGMGSEVAVVWADGELRSGLDASLGEQSGKLSLAVADVGLPVLPRVGTLALFVDTDEAATGCRMCGGDLAGARVVSHTAPLEAFGFALPARLDATSAQPQIDDVARHFHVSGDGVDGISTDISLDNAIHVENESLRGHSFALAASSDAVGLQEISKGFVGDAALARELSGGGSGPVSLDQIIGIHRLEWSGHVFNLETESGWYAADGIITHNCRCTTFIRRISPLLRPAPVRRPDALQIQTADHVRTRLRPDP